MAEKFFVVEKPDYLSSLCGNFDENLKMIEKQYNVTAVVRGEGVKLKGDGESVDSAYKAIASLLTLIYNGESLNEQNVRYVFSMVSSNEQEQIEELIDNDCICITTKGRPVKPKTLGQKKYVESIKKNTVTIGVGPAGTGKTYLAVAMAVNAFKAKKINRIILTRPAVEAGEKLGF